MIAKYTPVLRVVNEAVEKDYRIIACYGGSSSSKTVSILQILSALTRGSKRHLVVSVIGESIPVLKRSVIHDWQTLVMGDLFDPTRYNKNELIYHWPNGCLWQFIPADAEPRFFAMRHDFVMIDEAFNVPKGIFDQIEIRTREKIFLTWNPVAEFWGKQLEDRPDAIIIHSTYKDNPYVSPQIVRSLELRAETDPNFYRVFVLGQYGTYEGLVFKENENWFKCKAWPADDEGTEVFKWRVYGLDFGFSHNPSAYIEIRYSDGQLWAKEHFYETGLLNPEIAELIYNLGAARMDTVADAAEPKSIAEIRRDKKHRCKIHPAIKGPDSVKFGINQVKQYRLNVFEDSLNLIKELRNYSWRKDKKTGLYLNEPNKGFDHLIDALRYAVTYKVKYPGTGEYKVS